uniref:Immunoglobulin I-set domain-containing protein n=1 Tax=Panagrolaimus davidi TaxID=227884 RepID=A0A914PAY8_9BILA
MAPTSSAGSGGMKGEEDKPSNIVAEENPLEDVQKEVEPDTLDIPYRDRKRRSSQARIVTAEQSVEIKKTPQAESIDGIQHGDIVEITTKTTLTTKEAKEESKTVKQAFHGGEASGIVELVRRDSQKKKASKQVKEPTEKAATLVSELKAKEIEEKAKSKRTHSPSTNVRLNVSEPGKVKVAEKTVITAPPQKEKTSKTFAISEMEKAEKNIKFGTKAAEMSFEADKPEDAQKAVGIHSDTKAASSTKKSVKEPKLEKKDVSAEFEFVEHPEETSITQATSHSKKVKKTTRPPKSELSKVEADFEWIEPEEAADFTRSASEKRKLAKTMKETKNRETSTETNLTAKNKDESTIYKLAKEEEAAQKRVKAPRHEKIAVENLLEAVVVADATELTTKEKIHEDIKMKVSAPKTIKKEVSFDLTQNEAKEKAKTIQKDEDKAKTEITTAASKSVKSEVDVDIEKPEEELSNDWVIADAESDTAELIPKPLKNEKINANFEQYGKEDEESAEFVRDEASRRSIKKKLAPSKEEKQDIDFEAKQKEAKAEAEMQQIQAQKEKLQKSMASSKNEKTSTTFEASNEEENREAELKRSDSMRASLKKKLAPSKEETKKIDFEAQQEASDQKVKISHRESPKEVLQKRMAAPKSKKVSTDFEVSHDEESETVEHKRDDSKRASLKKSIAPVGDKKTGVSVDLKGKDQQDYANLEHPESESQQIRKSLAAVKSENATMEVDLSQKQSAENAEQNVLDSQKAKALKKISAAGDKKTSADFEIIQKPEDQTTGTKKIEKPKLETQKKMHASKEENLSDDFEVNKLEEKADSEFHRKESKRQSAKKKVKQSIETETSSDLEIVRKDKIEKAETKSKLEHQETVIKNIKASGNETSTTEFEILQEPEDESTEFNRSESTRKTVKKLVRQPHQESTSTDIETTRQAENEEMQHNETESGKTFAKQNLTSSTDKQASVNADISEKTQDEKAELNRSEKLRQSKSKKLTPSKEEKANVDFEAAKRQEKQMADVKNAGISKAVATKTVAEPSYETVSADIDAKTRADAEAEITRKEKKQDTFESKFHPSVETEATTAFHGHRDAEVEVAETKKEQKIQEKAKKDITEGKTKRTKSPEKKKTEKKKDIHQTSEVSTAVDAALTAFEGMEETLAVNRTKAKTQRETAQADIQKAEEGVMEAEDAAFSRDDQLRKHIARKPTIHKKQESLGESEFVVPENEEIEEAKKAESSSTEKEILKNKESDFKKHDSKKKSKSKKGVANEAELEKTFTKSPTKPAEAIGLVTEQEGDYASKTTKASTSKKAQKDVETIKNESLDAVASTYPESIKLQKEMSFAEHEVNALKDAQDASIEASDKPTFSRSSSKQQKSSKKKMMERHASGISLGAGEYSEAESVQSAVDFALSQSNIIESGNESVTLDAEFSINRGVTEKDAEIFRRHQARQKAAMFKHLRQSSEESISTDQHIVAQSEARASRKGKNQQKAKKSMKESTEESISMSKELESGVIAEGAEQKLAEMDLSEKVKKHITPEGEKSIIYEKVLAKPDTMQFVVEALREKLEAADAKSLREPLTQNVSVEFVMDSDRESECSASSTQSSTADTLRAKKRMQESKESTTSVTENIITAPKTLHVETTHRRRSCERSEKTVMTSKEAYTGGKEIDQEDAETQHKKSLKAKKVYSEATEETTTVTSVFKLQNKEAATESIKTSKSPKLSKANADFGPGHPPEEESIEVFLSDEVHIGAKKRIKQLTKEVERKVDITKLPENAKAKGAISLKETIQMSKSAKVPENDEKSAAAIAELKETLDVSKQPRKKKSYKKSVSAESMHSEYVTASEGYGDEDVEDETFIGEKTEAIKHSVRLGRVDTIEKAEETFSDEEAESVASTVEESKDEATMSDIEISKKPKVPSETVEGKIKVAKQKQKLATTVIALPESDKELENVASKLAKDAENVALDSPTVKGKLLPPESDEDTSIHPQLERMTEQADALANLSLQEREKAMKDLQKIKETNLDKTLAADIEAKEEAKSIFKKRPPVKIRKRVIKHEESIYDVEALAKPEEKYETVEVTLKMEIKLQEQKSLRSQSKERKEAAAERQIEEEEKKPMPKLAAKAKKLQKHRRQTRHPSSERESEAEVEPEPTTFNFPEEKTEAMQTVADKLEEYGNVNAVLAVQQTLKEQQKAYFKESEKESEDLFIGMRKIGDQGLAEVIIRDIYGTKLDVFKITKQKIQKLDEELEKRGMGKIIEMYIEQSPESDADDEMSVSSKATIIDDEISIPTETLVDNREALKAKVNEMVGGTVTAGKKSKAAHPRENVIKPSFLQKKQRITAKKGQSLVVKLKLMANPEPRMSIYRNEAYMEEDDRINIIVEKDKYLYTMILMIDSVDQTFEGEITFVATNEHGHDEAKVILNIEGSITWVFFTQIKKKKFKKKNKKLI